MIAKIIDCAKRVHLNFGPGYVDRVYENALLHELQCAKIPAQAQQGIQVPYDGVPVGQFVADILVDSRIMVEIEASQVLQDLHLAQGLNYLKATGLDTCLVLNFGAPELEIRPLVRTSGFCS